MKNRTKTIFLSLMAALFALTACNRSEDVMEGPLPQPQPQPKEGEVLSLDLEASLKDDDLSKSRTMMTMEENPDGTVRFTTGVLQDITGTTEKTSPNWQCVFVIRKKGAQKAYFTIQPFKVSDVDGKIKLKATLKIDPTKIYSHTLDDTQGRAGVPPHSADDPDFPKYGEECYVTGYVFNQNYIREEGLTNAQKGSIEKFFRHIGLKAFKGDDLWILYNKLAPNQAPMVLTFPWTKVQLSAKAEDPNPLAKVKLSMRGSLFKITIDNTHPQSKKIVSTLYLRSVIGASPYYILGLGSKLRFPKTDDEVVQPALFSFPYATPVGLSRRVSVEKGEKKTYYMWTLFPQHQTLYNIHVPAFSEETLAASKEYVRVSLPTSYEHGTVGYIRRGSVHTTSPKEGHVYPITIEMRPFIKKDAPHPLELSRMAEYNVSRPISGGYSIETPDHTTTFASKDEVDAVAVPGYHLPTFEDWTSIFGFRKSSTGLMSSLDVRRDKIPPRSLYDGSNEQTETSYLYAQPTPEVSGLDFLDEESDRTKYMSYCVPATYKVEFESGVSATAYFSAIRFSGQDNKRTSAWRYRYLFRDGYYVLEIKQIYIGPYFAGAPDFFSDNFWSDNASHVVTREIPIVKSSTLGHHYDVFFEMGMNQSQYKQEYKTMDQIPASLALTTYAIKGTEKYPDVMNVEIKPARALEVWHNGFPIARIHREGRRIYPNVVRLFKNPETP